MSVVFVWIYYNKMCTSSSLKKILNAFGDGWLI